MAYEVFMPKSGMDMQEGTIIRWLVEVGDAVRAGEPLVEIETDKVTMEVEAPADGILLCKYFDDGAVVPVVTIIGYIGQEGEAVPEKPTLAGGKARAEDEEIFRGRKVRNPGSRDFEYRVAVIGGGSAGYTAALKAAGFGGRVILFEKDELGGKDLGGGNIALKVLLKNAKIVDAVKKAYGRGISGERIELRPDALRMIAEAKKTADAIRQDIRKKLEAAGVEIVTEEASMIEQHTIRAGQMTYRAEKTILCCGSEPKRFGVPGEEQPEIIEPTQMFYTDTVPEEILVIGGGVVGCEIASVCVRFCRKVTLIEKQSILIPTFDHEVSAEIERTMKADGIRVIKGVGVNSFERQDDRPVAVLTSGEEISADLVIAAIGRKPKLDGFGVLLKEIDLERGKVMVDEYCRTGIEDVFACGDMTNQSIQAHSAMKMGDAAAMVASNAPKAAALNRAPLLCCTIPEAAGIGLTEREARKRGEILVGKCRFYDNMKARAEGETEGWVKVIADRGYGEILGVHIVGGPATELIVEAKSMMDMEITIFEVAEIMHPHPTWSEAFMRACADAVQKAR